MQFSQILQSVRKGVYPNGHDVKVLALDPGETTGVCTLSISRDLRKVRLDSVGQLNTGLLIPGGKAVRKHIELQQPSIVVIEDYKIYGWKADSHSWSNLHTPKLVGLIEFFCDEMHIECTKQSAQTGKGFCTDEKLKEWGFYQTGLRHANDAIRHACQSVLFSKHEHFHTH